MTDMRATERLLEVIEDATRILGEHKIWATVSSESKVVSYGDVEETHRMVSLDQHVVDLQTAITELRRRGDTLVRRDDLIALYEGWGDDAVQGGVAMLERIENAIGGKLR